MTFHIETKIKNGSEFIPIDEWKQPFPDPQYIEGAIVMTHDGEAVLGEDFWDDVNYMWPYLMNGLPDIAAGKNWQTQFPDQPITFSVQHVSPEWLLLHVYAADEEYVKKKIRKSEYLTQMTRAGRFFLTKLREVCPEADLPFDHYQLLLDRLQLS